MKNTKTGPHLSKTELAAVNLLIAHLQDTNKAHLESDGFIDSIVGIVSSAASVVGAAASVVAATAATAANAAVGAVEAVAPEVVAIAPEVAEVAAAVLAANSSSASMQALISRLGNTDLASHLTLENLIEVRNRFGK